MPGTTQSAPPRLIVIPRQLEGFFYERLAEEFAGRLSAPWVTARAVARLDKLARWCVPLLTPGGTMIAMKGRSAEQELTEDRPALLRLGLSAARVSAHGMDVFAEPVLTVDLQFTAPPTKGRSAGRRRIGALALGEGRVAEGVFPADVCLLYTSPSPRDRTRDRMPASA